MSDLGIGVGTSDDLYICYNKEEFTEGIKEMRCECCCLIILYSLFAISRATK